MQCIIYIYINCVITCMVHIYKSNPTINIKCRFARGWVVTYYIEKKSRDRDRDIQQTQKKHK